MPRAPPATAPGREVQADLEEARHANAEAGEQPEKWTMVVDQSSAGFAIRYEQASSVDSVD